MVVDTSALLAVYLEESRGAWVLEEFARSPRLRMSTINLAECLIKFQDRKPSERARMEVELFNYGIEFVAPDVEQARIAAAARKRYPLNIGDCFAYALAKVSGDSLITLDRDFRTVDVPVFLPPVS